MNFKKNLQKVPVILASTQTEMFAAEYRSDNSSGLHCRVIKIQHQTELLYLSGHSGTADSFNYNSAPTWSDAWKSANFRLTTRNLE